MQTRKTSNTRHVQSSQTGNPYARYMQADPRRAAILIGVLCVILPPAGIALAWRSRRMTIFLRAAMSAAGFLSMTVLFALLMRPAEFSSDIRPTPVVPVLNGYGTTATEEPTAVPVPESTAVPVIEAPISVPDAAAPAATEEPFVLTDDTIVFAVTNNASSYHLAQICEMQENNRQLTLREALDEGLKPCEKCAGAAG